MANATPEEVLVEFLRALHQVLDESQEEMAPVLRGSLLLRHWFGNAARPAADIDLECFELPRLERLSEEEEEYRGDGIGRWGEYQSLVDFGKAMCRYAAESSRYYQWSRPRRAPPEVEFLPLESISEGSSLWVYGTPGERYLAGWIWHGRGGTTGQLQIDIAEPGSYRLDDIDVAEVQLVGPGGDRFPFLAYTREMMLAAKVSWLLRSLGWRASESGGIILKWTGEPKDLFDVHLLLTRSDLNAAAFQKSLLAVGAADALDWDNLEVFFQVRRAEMSDDDFSNWSDFRQRHELLVASGPVELLETIADRLEPLLGDFFLPEETPFLYAIHADPANEFPYAIYADWLEDRGDPRCNFLRLLMGFQFHEEEQSPEQFAQLCAALGNCSVSTSEPWLHRLFGTSQRFREFTRRIGVHTPDVFD
jgi:uncharacterized protein (TIGR02996 family)